MADANGFAAFAFTGVSTTAQDARLGLASLVGNGTPRAFGARGGSRPGSAVSTVSGSTVTVPPRAMTVEPAATNTQGPYLVSWRSSQTVVLDPPSSSNARIDLIIVRVYDTLFDASGQTAVVLDKVTGTPSGTPVAPAVPAGACVVDVVSVPASGGGAATIVKGPVAVAAGGVLPVNGTSDYPAVTNLSDGDAVLWDRNRGDFVVRIGSTWSLRDTSPNKPVIKFGTSSVTLNTSANATITFPAAFAGTPQSVQITPASNGGGFSSAILGDVSATGFTFTGRNNLGGLMNNGSSNVTVAWTALYQP